MISPTSGGDPNKLRFISKLSLFPSINVTVADKSPLFSDK